MDSTIIPPIIDVDGENQTEALLLAKSLGYFYIPRSTSYGRIPDENLLKYLVEDLFSLPLETKLSLSSNYIRSTNLNDPPSKKETFSFTSTDKINTIPKTTLIKILLNISKQLSNYLTDLLELSVDFSSSTSDIIQFNHFSQTNEPLVLNKTEDTHFQFHLFSTCHLEQYDTIEQEWKLINTIKNSQDYILVTLPNFFYRYSIDDLSHYTINYICYNNDDTKNLNDENEKRTYLLSLTQNKALRYITFFYLYVMQGVPAGFSSTALANYLTAEGETSSTIGTFVSLSGLPWALQFVWGPLIDRFQSSPMGRRRPWVIASQICAFLASLGLLFVSDPPTQYIKTLVIAFFIHSIFASIQDASVDAQAITTIPLNERGRINGFMRGGFLVGSALGAAGLSWILRNVGYITAALINSIFLFLFTFLTFFIKEKSSDQLFPCRFKKDSNRDRKQVYQKEHDYSIKRLFVELFKGLLTIQSLRLFIPILIVYSCQSAFIRAYNIHLINVLGWSDTSVSILSGAWGTVIVLVVVLIGGWLADRIGARYLLIIVIFIHACYMSIANLLGSYWYKRSVATTILVLWSMMDPILSAAAMPVLMSLCRKHVEGSQFTTYMSMVNLCDLLGAFISGHLQRHFPANTIGLACAVLIIGALIIAFIGVYYDYRNSPQKTNIFNKKLFKTCWPIRICTNYHRGSFKIIV